MHVSTGHTGRRRYPLPCQRAQPAGLAGMTGPGAGHTLSAPKTTSFPI
jgi:hypothetical protein